MNDLRPFQLSFLCKEKLSCKLLLEHLKLSSEKVFVSKHRQSILSLALEKQEETFLLSSSLDSSFSLFKLSDFDNFTRKDSRKDRRGESLSPSVIHLAPLATRSSDPGTSRQSGAVTQISWYPLDYGLFSTISTDGQLVIWNTHTFKETFWFSNLQSGKLVSQAFHRNGSLIAVGCSDPCTIRICDLKSGVSLHRLTGHSSPVNSLLWHPWNDHQLVSSGFEDNSIHLWDIRRSGIISSFTASTQVGGTAHTGSILSLNFAVNDARFFYSWSSDGFLKKWSFGTSSNPIESYFIGKSKENDYSWSAHVGLPVNLGNRAFLPVADAYFIFALKNQLYYYDVIKRSFFKGALGRHIQSITCLISSERTHSLITAGKDEQILYWEPETQKKPFSLH